LFRVDLDYRILDIRAVPSRIPLRSRVFLNALPAQPNYGARGQKGDQPNEWLWQIERLVLAINRSVGSVDYGVARQHKDAIPSSQAHPSSDPYSLTFLEEVFSETAIQERE
jgi:hypothetical protein